METREFSCQRWSTTGCNAPTTTTFAPPIVIGSSVADIAAFSDRNSQVGGWVIRSYNESHGSVFFFLPISARGWESGDFGVIFPNYIPTYRRRDTLLPSLTWKRRVQRIGVSLKLRPRKTSTTARPYLPTVFHPLWCTMWKSHATDLTTGQRHVPSHRRNTTASVWFPAQPPSHPVAAAVAAAAGKIKS